MVLKELLNAENGLSSECIHSATQLDLPKREDAKAVSSKTINFSSS